ncbi:Integral membrane protein sed5 [Entamoeba marina]
MISSNRNDFFDRTSQFKQYVEKNASIKKNLPNQKNQNNRSEMINDVKQFNKATTSLFGHINGVAAKLTKLTELAKMKSLFEEQQTAPQIQRLTNEIHINLQEVNKEMKDVQATSKIIHEKYSTSQQTDAHRQVVYVLQIRAESIKAQQEKKQQKYIPPSQGSQTYERNMSGFSFHDDTPTTDDDVEVDIPQSTSLVLSNEHLEQRVQGVQNIERMLNELLGLYNHITFLVTTQEEMVKRIDENTEQAVFNVEEGHSNLQEAFASISSNRGLIIKSLLVVMFFAIVFLVFFL